MTKHKEIAFFFNLVCAWILFQNASSNSVSDFLFFFFIATGSFSKLFHFMVPNWDGARATEITSVLMELLQA